MYMFFPKKLVYLVYIGVFELGSLVCALAPNSNALIVGRAVSGLGASGIFAGSLIIVATIAPLQKRPLLTGITNGSFGASQIIGPLIGGAFAQNITWRWCFWINLPAGGVSIGLILLFLRVQKSATESTPFKTKLKNLDLLGFCIFVGAITMLLLALQWGGVVHAWNSSIVIGLLVGFGVAFLVFIGSQWYAADSALIPPKIFYYRTVILAFGACLFGPGGVATIIYYLPIWFQAVQGATPISSGVRYLPSVISDVLTSIVGGGIVMSVGWYNPFYIFGVAILAIGSGLLSTLSPTTDTGKWIGYQILTGSGYSFMVTMVSTKFTPVQAIIDSAAASHRTSSSSSSRTDPCRIYNSFVCHDGQLLCIFGGGPGDIPIFSHPRLTRNRFASRSRRADCCRSGRCPSSNSAGKPRRRD
jgi:MFS family permease